MSVFDAARQGYYQGLCAVRDELASALEVCEPQVKAQVAAQLAKVLQTLDHLERQKPEVSAADDIAAELAEGLAGAKVVQLASRGGQRRAR